MVDIDYSYRDSKYYELWYKKGIVPTDNLYMGYCFVNQALKTVGNIWDAAKSSDNDGGGGVASPSNTNKAKQEEYETERKNKKIQSEFVNGVKKLKKGDTPSKELVDLAKQVKNMDGIDDNLKKKAQNIADSRGVSVAENTNIGPKTREPQAINTSQGN